MADEVEEQQPVEQPVEEAPAAPAAPEFDFRAAYQEQQRQIAILAQNLAAQQAAMRQQAQPAPARGQSSLEDLWTRAQQGDQAAFDEWQDRKVEAKLGQRFQQHTRYQATVAQLNALYQKYPEFADPTHPLTQKANQFYAVLTQMGEAPGQDTQLQAMLRAAADSRDVVASPPQRAATRPSAAGQIGVSHQGPTARAEAPRTTPREMDLARRMGIKDPAKARERFEKRQAEGKSSVHHSIAAYLEGQGNQ